MKKDTKKNETTNNDIIAEIEKRFGRHTNVLMEQMRHEVKTVAEGHGIIIKKLEEHDKKFTKIESELDTISMAVMDTNERVKLIEKKMGGHETRIKKVEEKVFV